MSEAIDAGHRPKTAKGAKTTHIITICSPKGGVGKTTLARSLLVAAAQAGIQSIGLDFDRQGSLRKWAIRRAATRNAFPDQFVSAEVIEADLHDWRGSLRRIKDFDLAIIDTPPSVEEHLPAIQGLCHEACFVVVPTGYTQDDLDSVVPWMQTVNESGARAAFCLNRANRRTSIFARSRAKLIKAGAVCPVEIPLLEDVHAHADSGLTVLDIAKSRGLEPMEAVWDFVRREVGL